MQFMAEQQKCSVLHTRRQLSLIPALASVAQVNILKLNGLFDVCAWNDSLRYIICISKQTVYLDANDSVFVWIEVDIVVFTGNDRL